MLHCVNVESETWAVAVEYGPNQIRGSPAGLLIPPDPAQYVRQDRSAIGV
jgi:hypothetical protein